MAAVVTDQEVDAWLGGFAKPLPPWAMDRKSARSVLQEMRDGRELADARKAAAATPQTSEIAILRAECQALRRRVKALESAQGNLRKELNAVLDESWRDINKEIKAVRDTQLKFGDIFQPGKAYAPNTFAVNKGSLWVSLAATVDPPGTARHGSSSARGQFRQAEARMSILPLPDEASCRADRPAARPPAARAGRRDARPRRRRSTSRRARQGLDARSGRRDDCCVHARYRPALAVRSRVPTPMTFKSRESSCARSLDRANNAAC